MCVKQPVPIVRNLKNELLIRCVVFEATCIGIRFRQYESALVAYSIISKHNVNFQTWDPTRASVVIRFNPALRISIFSLIAGCQVTHTCSVEHTR